MNELPRRRLLAATGTALTGAVAGCMGGDDGNGDGGNGNGDGDESADPETGSETTEAASGTLLGEISLENMHDEAHTIDVIVEFGDGPEHWSTHELPENDGAELERNWPTEPGSFSVMFRLDGGEPTQVTPARWNDPDCVNLFAMIGRNGELTVPSTTEGGPCGSGDATLDDAEE